VLLTRLKHAEQRLTYAKAAIEHGWSRNALNIHIETCLLERSGTAITNFELSLQKPQSDLARESLKDPYRFDFLDVGQEASERDIEAALVKHVTDFLLELGAGFVVFIFARKRDARHFALPERQSPPSALSKVTLATSLRPAMSRALLSAPSDAACAETTFR
jgi:predicted nuclease of restriction endonuclease-like (RecB) superfamily